MPLPTATNPAPHLNSPCIANGLAASVPPAAAAAGGAAAVSFAAAASLLQPEGDGASKPSAAGPAFQRLLRAPVVFW